MPEFNSIKVNDTRIICKTQIGMSDVLFRKLSVAAGLMKAEILFREVMRDHVEDWTVLGSRELSEKALDCMPVGWVLTPWPVVHDSGKDYSFDQLGKPAKPFDIFGRTTLGEVFESLFRIVKTKVSTTVNEEKDDISNCGDESYILEYLQASKIAISSNEGLEPKLLPKSTECNVPVCNWKRIAERPGRTFIIDSGTSANVMQDKIAKDTVRQFIRRTEFELEFDTANSTVTADTGVRAIVGKWDMPSDYIIMEDSPELISMGERCMLQGFTHVWVSKKYPCFISPGSRYIVIFDLDGVLPIWSPAMDTQRTEYLGSWHFWKNAFRDRCGIFINPSGEVCLDIVAPKDFYAEDEKHGSSSGLFIAPVVQPAYKATVGQVLGRKTSNQDELHEMMRELNEPRVSVPICVNARDSKTQNIDLESVFQEVGETWASTSLEEDGGSSPFMQGESPGLVAEQINLEAPNSGSSSDPGLNTEKKVTLRKIAKSKNHLLLHKDFNPECPGCQAKARNRKHFKGSFDRNNPRYADTISMDQVSLTDVDGTLGIGNYRYALVLCKVALDHWDFVPLKTMGSEETDRAFREFCAQHTPDITTVLVYCDAHASLIRVCDNHSVSRRHSPPGRPQANAVIERKIQKALLGLRAYLVSGCTPNCFWPFAGHCYAFNENLSVNHTGASAYETVVGTFTHMKFVYGQLCFYKPAPTIYKPAKTDSTLRPGVFLDYYVDCAGKFSGQYIVCDLEDFANKNLHHRMGPKHF